MKPPRTIAVGPYRFTVTQAPLENPTDGTLHSYAVTQKNQETITLHTGQSAGNLRDTLFHEVLHTCWHAGCLPSGQEEEIIGTLSPLLLDTLRRNPRLIEFLFEDL